MSLWRRPSVGLLGRIFAILLLTLVIEVGASTLLYERASQYSVREDEARRLAEHLVIAERLLAENPRHERPALADQLTTDRYIVRWAIEEPPAPPVAPALDEMRRQVVTWEPGLARTGLRLRLLSPGRGGIVGGSLRLPDGSWLLFSTTAPLHAWGLTIGRILLALAPAAALILLAGLLLRRTVQPLRQLVVAADRIGTADDAPELVERGTGELRRLVRAFNGMQARIHRLIAERTEALAAVGHDLRTPLARLRLRLDGIAAPDVRRALSADLTEMEEMVTSLLDYLGGEEDPEAPVLADLAVLAATLVDDAEDRGFPARYDGPDHLETRYRASAMRRALTNLTENALHYAGSVELCLEARDDAIRLVVADRGPGIPPAQLDEVLRPFARLDPARQRNTGGLGLGLAIVARAIDREGGRLTLSNRAGGGLAVEILLPRTAPAAA